MLHKAIEWVIEGSDTEDDEDEAGAGLPICK